MSSPVLVASRRPARRFFVAIGWLVPAAVSVLVLRNDLAWRREAANLFREAGLEGRPATLSTLELIEPGELAAAFAAEAVLDELAPGGESSGAAARFGASGRRALASARDLAARGLAERPGNVMSLLLLARSGFALWNLDGSPSAESARAWARTFELAGEAAPGLDIVFASGADAQLRAWPRLSEGERKEAMPTLRRALLSASFVRRAYPDVRRAVGPDAAEGLLPDEAGALSEAAAALRAVGQASEAESIEARRSGLAAPK